MARGTYSPACVAVPQDRLEDGPVLQADGVIGVPIAGVDPDDAIAVRYRFDISDVPRDERAAARVERRRCGVWQLAPERGTSAEDVDGFDATLALGRSTIWN